VGFAAQAVQKRGLRNRIAALKRFPLRAVITRNSQDRHRKKRLKKLMRVFGLSALCAMI